MAKRQKFEIYECTAPAHWASYLINGDASSLDDADQAEADAFQAEMNRRGYEWPVSCSDEADYGAPDFGACGDILTYSFLKPASG
jgi:hypothetical protein